MVEALGKPEEKGPCDLYLASLRQPGTSSHGSRGAGWEQTVEASAVYLEFWRPSMFILEFPLAQTACTALHPVSTLTQRLEYCGYSVHFVFRSVEDDGLPHATGNTFMWGVRGQQQPQPTPDIEAWELPVSVVPLRSLLETCASARSELPLHAAKELEQAKRSRDSPVLGG